MQKRTIHTVVFLVAIMVMVAGMTAGRAAPGRAEPAQTEVTLFAVADATVESWQPNANFGSATTLDLLCCGIDAVQEALFLVRFDLTSLPADAVIDSANLQLYLTAASGASPVSVAVSYVTGPWDEHTVTWNDFPQAEPIAIQAPVDSTVDSFKTWAITSYAAAWHSSPAENYGVFLRGPSNGFARTFESREGGSFTPQLMISYHVPAPTATVTRTPTPPAPTNTPTNTATTTVTPTPTLPAPTNTATATTAATPTPSVTYTPTPRPSPTPVITRLTLCAVADAYIAQEFSTLNTGNGSQLRLGYSSGPDSAHHRALVRFDLSGIPQDTAVVSAHFEAFLEDGAGSLSPVNIGLYQVAGVWTESGVTWHNQPPVAASSEGSRNVDLAPGYWRWDVTNLAQRWVEGSAMNDGVELRGPQINSWARNFSSREGQYCPRLILTLESAAPVPSPTPTYTPMPTSTATPTRPPVDRSVQITAVEINQAIQDLGSLVPLVAGKRAVVRVHLRVTDGGGDIANVGGRLQYPFPGGPIFNPVNLGGTVTVRANPDRARLDHTLNFVLPAAWAQSGGTMLVRVFAPPGMTFNGQTEVQDARPVTFQQVPPLRVVYVPISYTVNSSVYQPYTGAIGDANTWLRQAYPVPNVVSQQHATTLVLQQPNSLCSASGWATLDNRIATLHSTSSTTLGANTLYYGLVPSDYAAIWCPGPHVGGRANGIPSSDAAGEIYNGSPDYTGTMAGHELAHTLGRYHAEFCGAEGGQPYPYPEGGIGGTGFEPERYYGLNMDTMLIYDPTWRSPPTLKHPNGVLVWTDIMTYCSSQWISDFTYRGLRDRLVQFPRQPAAADVSQELVLVSGLINQTRGEIDLDPLYRLSLAFDEAPQPGSCTITLRDAGNNVLASYPFTPRVSSDPAEGEDEILTIHELVPDNPDLDLVEVACEGMAPASREASVNPPVVEILSPNGGENWSAETETIRWAASDADGDTLHFLVQFSSDDGTTWTTLAVDTTATEYSLQTRLLAGGDQARVRVIASDGLLTAQDTSDGVFVVAPKPPQVALGLPGNGNQFEPEELISFAGSAFDPEDGPLAGEALTWESDRDGLLGSGESLLLAGQSLTHGEHRITLTATDSDGQRGTASVSIFVGYRTYLPEMSLSAPYGAGDAGE